jgi:hypothetical protein
MLTNENRFNCYRFAIVTFSAIQQYQSRIAYNASLHKAFKLSSFLGVELVDKREVYTDVISVLILFFEQKLKQGVQERVIVPVGE